MSIRRLLLVCSLATAPLLACGSGSDVPAEQGDDQDVTSRSDTAIKQEIAATIVGLETGGGEGDPDPYKVADVKLAAGETMTNAVLLKKLLPRLKGLAHDQDEMIPGLEESSITRHWADVTAEPTAADYPDADELRDAREQAAKWRDLKKVVDLRLKNVKYFDMGYRFSEGGSIETGAVAHVVVGQTASGRVIAIYGIDIWT